MDFRGFCRERLKRFLFDALQKSDIPFLGAQDEGDPQNEGSIYLASKRVFLNQKRTALDPRQLKNVQVSQSTHHLIYSI